MLWPRLEPASGKAVRGTTEGHRQVFCQSSNTAQMTSKKSLLVNHLVLHVSHPHQKMMAIFTVAIQESEGQKQVRELWVKGNCHQHHCGHKLDPGWQTSAVTKLSKAEFASSPCAQPLLSRPPLSLPRNEFSSLQTKKEDAQRQKGFST